ncbi:hypothetical protein PO909_004498 [Leuciscus waleckii]
MQIVPEFMLDLVRKSFCLQIRRFENCYIYVKDFILDVFFVIILAGFIKVYKIERIFAWCMWKQSLSISKCNRVHR